MENEFFIAFNSIQVEKLSEDDKKELLRLFVASKNRIVYTQIAFIFSSLNYAEAVPYILKKINNKEFYNGNGSLVYAPPVQVSALEHIRLLASTLTKKIK